MEKIKLRNAFRTNKI